MISNDKFQKQLDELDRQLRNSFEQSLTKTSCDICGEIGLTLLLMTLDEVIVKCNHCDVNLHCDSNGKVTKVEGLSV